MKKHILILSAIGLLSTDTLAQEVKKLSTYNILSAGITLGHFTDMPKAFTGEDRDPLDKTAYTKNTRFDKAIGVYGEIQLSPIIGLQVGYNYSQSSGGNDIGYYLGNFHRAHVAGTFSFTNMSTIKDDPYTNFYGKAGIGYLNYEAQNYFHEGNAINEMAYRKANATEISLGLGFRIHFSDQWRMEVETGYQVVWDNGFDGDAFSYRDGQDQYMLTNVGVAYTFGLKSKRALHKTPVFSADYLWNDPIIKKHLGLSEDEVKDLVDEYLDDMNSKIDSIDGQLADLDDRMSKLDKMQAMYVDGFNKGKPIYIRNVFFAFDKDFITKQYQKVVFETSMILKAHPEYKLDITGVTDVYGPESYNSGLRVRRAKAVKKLLTTKFGIDADRIILNSQKEKISGKPYQHLNRRSTMLIYTEN
jgi:outer membrane protein OmpA-like peptidoglycan-associated protein